MILEDQIRDLLRDGLDGDLAPLSAHELETRALSNSAGPSTRNRSLLIAACVIGVAGLGIGLALLRTDRSAPVAATTSTPDEGDAPVAGAKVGRYFIPTGMPDNFRLLGVTENAGNPDEVSMAQSLYIDEANIARVTLSAAKPEWRWTNADNTTNVNGGTAMWSRFEFLDSHPVITFQVARGDLIVNGEATGVADEDLPALFEAVQLAAQDDIPTIDDPAYIRRSSAALGARQTVAQWSAYYGPPGGYFGMAGIEIRVEEFDQPIDTTLEAGVWDTTTTVDGRALHLGVFNSSPWWTPSPDIKVSVSTAGETGNKTTIDFLATLSEIDDVTFQTLIDRITETAASVPTTERLEFPSGAQLDLLGAAGNERGLCLTIDNLRRCDLSLMVRSGYSSNETLLTTNADLLLDEHWYTIGLAPAATQLDPTAETVEGTNGTWYLVRHPDDAQVAANPAGVPGITSRPAR